MSDIKKKYTRTQVGSVLKSKNPGEPDYIKVKTAVTLKEGQVLRLESQKFKLESLQKAVDAGKISEDVAAKRRESIEKMPGFVRFYIVMLETE